MTIFIQVVLPVLLVFGAGFAIQKWQRVDIKPLSVVALYVATPALVFQTFYHAEIDRQYGYMVAFALLLLFAIIFINKLAALVTKRTSEEESGWILGTAFMNSGNYGAPIILFAYGQEGFAFAVSFMVLQAIIMNIFGVYYAAKGRSGVRFALKSVIGMPVTYAVILGLLVQLSGATVPDNLLGTVDILAEAAIPMVMIILGMQLANMSWGQFEWKPLSYVVTVRLLVSPLIAYLLTLIFPFDPLLANVLIISAAMPSAATIVMFAVQFNTMPKFISSVTLVSTIISIFTITLLLMILN